MDWVSVFIIVLEIMALAGVIWFACVLRRLMRPWVEPNTSFQPLSPVQAILLTILMLSFGSLAIYGLVHKEVPAKEALGNIGGEVRSSPSKLSFSGNVLPFRVYNAFHGGPGGTIIDVGVRGGSQGDWAATAVFLVNYAREHHGDSIEVNVHTDNPWGAPGIATYLARAVDYTAANGQHIFAVTMSPKQFSDVEITYYEAYTEIQDKKMEADPNPSYDTQMAYLKASDKEATKFTIHKFHLNKNWKPPNFFKYIAKKFPVDGNNIFISNEYVDASSLSDLDECYNYDSGSVSWKGCSLKFSGIFSENN